MYSHLMLKKLSNSVLSYMDESKYISSVRLWCYYYTCLHMIHAFQKSNFQVILVILQFLIRREKCLTCIKAFFTNSKICSCNLLFGFPDMITVSYILKIINRKNYIFDNRWQDTFPWWLRYKWFLWPLF